MYYQFFSSTFSTIGIIGGGQLAKMIITSAAQLGKYRYYFYQFLLTWFEGYKCHVYCPETDSPAFQIATEKTKAAVFIVLLLRLTSPLSTMIIQVWLLLQGV